MSRKVYIYFLILFTLVSCIFLGLVCTHSGQMDALGQWNYLNGPVGDGYSPVEIMWWLFIFTPVWAGSGWLIDMETRDAKISLYRYSSMRQWWIKVIGKVYGLNLWYFLLMSLLIEIITTQGLNMDYIVRLIALTLHSMAMVTTMFWVYTLSQRIILAVATLIVLESISKIFILANIHPSVMPLVWGMYGYSDEIYISGGFVWSLSIVIQVTFSLTIVIVPLFIKKLILRSVKV